ncbi:U2 snRNP-associated SURP motif-containing protein-like isoform X3 [Eriocheir sinensis]|uniref:U2 snRNP-associated SURP motif-containing protein-like isoform X3 n=1 Tax=Eriocheir sinensis TaxID=95602 RepID=UPI0021C74F48|nr:U2 snRNP-associated SURP motif-containing protein-like isoform X3 [Eriocheir sinensis]
MTSRNKNKKEEEKKRQEEEAAAQAYEEFVATFEETPVQKGKVWVKAGTFDAGSRKEDTKEKGKLYKPTSKLAELAEKFSSAEKAAQYANNRVEKDKPEKPGKKKEKEKKKKSNLELFKEELKMIQEERAERHRIKNMYQTRESGKSSRFEAPEPKIPGFLGMDDPKIGSFDPGDPTTTNLYLGNLSPKITEQRLMELFGRYGPLASIKIMWPRTDDERNRGRNCGFVAFMNRKDGERALSSLNGKDIDGFEMKLGWGKAVPIPLHPIYIPPALVELTLPPPPSGLPFNAQPDKRDKEKSRKLPLIENLKIPPVGTPLPNEGEKKEEMDKILQRAVVKVVIPTERSLLQLIHRTIEFIVREGPMFEAMIMNREISNPDFRFLFENQSPAHVYYRWKLFSMLQGDSPSRWCTKPFRMFKNGSIWKPPPLNPFLQGMPEELIKKEEEEEEKNKKGSLSNAQRGRLESMIRGLVPERDKVGEAMVWCIEHADAAEEICQCLTEALTNNETALPKKIARLYLVSDILHNCSVKVSNASFYRKGFQSKLAEIFEGLHVGYNLVESRLRAEQVKQRIMQCCRAWEDWAIYPHEFLIHLQNIFLGLVKRFHYYQEPKMDLEEELMGTPGIVVSSVDARQLPTDDVDGIPIDDVDGIPIKEEEEEKEDIDGVPIANTPLIKSAAISALLGYDDDDDDEDIDGAPLDDDVDGIPMKDALVSDNGPSPGFVSSKWESVSPKRVQAQAVTTSKWEAVEANQSEDEGANGSDSTPVYDNSGPHTQSQNSHDEDDLDGIPLVYDDYKRKKRDSSEEDSQSQDNGSEYSEDSRGFDRLQGFRPITTAKTPLARQPPPPTHSHSPQPTTDDVSEERRARLREVEIRVLQYQDELEQGLRSLKPGYSIHRQVAHYRHKMMRKIEREEGSERRHHRHRSRSSSPEERRSTKRSRSRHPSRSRSPSSRRHRSRSPRKRRSHSRSPPRKHKKKSRH